MKTKAYIILVLFLAVIWSCKKQQPKLAIAADDPCDCATEVSAEFLIEDKLTRQFTNLHQDSVYIIADDIYAGVVRFRALEEGANYTWYLGTEVIDTQSFHRLFDDATIGSDITVSLAVSKSPNSLCFPNDDGYDSLSKTFHVYEYCDSSIMEGYFRIAEIGSIDSLDIGFDFVNYIGTTNCNGINIYNFDGQGTDFTKPSINLSAYRTYKHWILKSQTWNSNGDIFLFRAWLDSDGEFELWRAPGNNGGWNSFWSSQKIIYKGRKI
ncbi:MAG: hypothetical protein ACI8Q1_001288 [Parvicella sp.]